MLVWYVNSCPLVHSLKTRPIDNLRKTLNYSYFHTRYSAVHVIHYSRNHHTPNLISD